MGLDMYLKAKKHTYVSEYDINSDYPKEERDAIQKAVVDIEVPEAFNTYGLRAFECEAMYWRKANQIHAWFVSNVQKGEDDCGSYYVSKEQSKALRDDVRKVLLDVSKASEVLPTSRGCFFGNDAYDEWYFQDLEYTSKALTKILNMSDIDSWTFEYQSSW